MRKTPTKFLCHWCHEEIPAHSPYRTPVEEFNEDGERLAWKGTGWFVCGDGCPEKPEEAKVFTR